MPHLFANDYTFDDDDNLSFAYSLWQWLKKYIKPAMDTCAQSHLACSEFLLKMVLFFCYEKNYASLCDLICDYIIKCGMRDKIWSGTYMISNCFFNKSSRKLWSNSISKYMFAKEGRLQFHFLWATLYRQVGRLY